MYLFSSALGKQRCHILKINGVGMLKTKRFDIYIEPLDARGPRAVLGLLQTVPFSQLNDKHAVSMRTT